MLRLETKISNTEDVEQIMSSSINTKANIFIKRTVYNNRIKVPLAFMPRNHYLTLVSAYTPLKPYQSLGAISFWVYSYSLGKMTMKTQATAAQVCCFADIMDQLECSELKIKVENGKIQFITQQNLNSSNGTREVQFEICFSNSAALLLGFSKTIYTGKLGDIVTADKAYPAIFVRYIQILCHNVNGSKDSNMTFPETLAIYPLMNTAPTFNPHIAVNHRIEKGKVLDIEILDQDNRPFTHAPVYLEFYMSEGGEHEKKQGFFRFGKTTKLVLAEPVSKISLPYLYAFSSLKSVISSGKGSFMMLCDPGARYKSKNIFIQPISALQTTIATRRAIIKDIGSWSLTVAKTFNDPNLYIKARFERNTLILTTNLKKITLSASYLSYIQLTKDLKIPNIDIFEKEETRIIIKSEYLYTEDQRLLIYCVEFSTVAPIAVAARNMFTLDIINPHFWCWYELEKRTNVLTFFYKVISTYDDGTVFEEEQLPLHSELIANLFYK